MKKTSADTNSGLKRLPVALLTAFLFAGCVTTNQGVQNPTSQTIYNPMKIAAHKIVTLLNNTYPIKGKTFQITSTNFSQSGTRLNLPFSDQVSSFISTEIGGQGGITSIQEISENPIRVEGTYHVDDAEVILTVMLREMGASNSRDLAKAQTKMVRGQLSDSLFEPQFSRIGNTLVTLLEDHYKGLSTTLKVNVIKPLPATGTDHEMVLGEELQKILEHSLTNSDRFSCNTGSTSLPSTGNCTGTISGQYGITGEKLSILLNLSGPGNTLLSSASYDIPLDNIPKEYLDSTIRSLEDLLSGLCGSLAESCEKNRIDLEGKTVLLKPDWFSDTRENAVLPFSGEITRRFTSLIMEKIRCTVISEPDMNTEWLLAGEYSRNKETLLVGISLFQMNINTGGTGIALIQQARAQGTIPMNRCNPAWFNKNLKNVIHCLLNRMERKSLNSIDFKGNNKNEVLVKKIKFKNTTRYSPFSDYVNTDTLGYFADSLVFTPILDREKRLENFRTGEKFGFRGVLPVGINVKKFDPVAAITGAAYYTEGSYWPVHNNQVEMKINLWSTAGKLICSESITADSELVDPALFQLSQQQSQNLSLNSLESDDDPLPPSFQQNKTNKDSIVISKETNDSRLKLTIFTQKDRENLMFREGEEMVFYVHTNKDVYLYLYNQDGAGQILRIFPNAYSGGNRIKANHVAIIPDKDYAKGFKFQVDGQLGNEMIFAFASDRPLPELPGEEIGDVGVKQMNISIDAMKEQFSRYASRRGHFLAWDAISIYTQP